MTLHYHGTPITPNVVLRTLAGRCFCVSYAAPDQIEIAHEIGQSVMLDNGAFSVWKAGFTADWPGFYRWCERWLSSPTTWAVIPDVIDGGAEAQDALLRQWPFGNKGSPVWHMDEPLSRLIQLCDNWPRVCVGSTAQFAVVGSEPWRERMTDVWELLSCFFSFTPPLHMLRGMRLSEDIFPFASLDSTDIARNHNRKNAAVMADRWDARQCPPKWIS